MTPAAFHIPQSAPPMAFFKMQLGLPWLPVHFPTITLSHQPPFSSPQSPHSLTLSLRPALGDGSSLILTCESPRSWNRVHPRPCTLLCPCAANSHVLRSVPFPRFWATLPATAGLISYLPSSCPTHAEPSHGTENPTSECLMCSGDLEVTCIGCVMSRT